MVAKFKNKLIFFIIMKKVMNYLLITLLIIFPVAYASEEEDIILSNIDCKLEGHNSPYRYIAHAGGAIDGVIYVNSIEGMELAYSNGYKMFEVDLLITSDGKLIGSHGWSDWRNKTKKNIDHPDFNTVENTLLYDKYHAITMKYLNSFFLKHRDAILVTDKITDYKLLMNSFLYPNRLIAEVFNENDLKRALDAGILYPILSFVYTHDQVMSVKKKYDVKFIALHSATMITQKENISLLKDEGVCVYVYTSNEKTFLNEYIPSEIYGVYTDFYVPKSNTFNCVGNKCTTY
jgi:glycerophosphoryl diester phosphodiesterase